MEYIDGVNLGDLIYLPDEIVLEEEIIDWAIQMCDVLEYLHSNNPPIMHRDINPFNFIREMTTGKLL